MILKKTVFTFPCWIRWGAALAHHRLSTSCLHWVNRLTWVTPRFQTRMSDSLNMRLTIGCFLTIYKVILYARDSQSDSDPVIGRAKSVNWCSSGTSSWRPVWHDTIHGSLSSWKCWNSSYADGIAHFYSMPMYTWSESVPSCILCMRNAHVLIIHSGYFCSASSSPPLLISAPDYCIDTVSELVRRRVTGNCEN